MSIGHSSFTSRPRVYMGVVPFFVGMSPSTVTVMGSWLRPKSPRNESLWKVTLYVPSGFAVTAFSMTSGRTAAIAERPDTR